MYKRQDECHCRREWFIPAPHGNERWLLLCFQQVSRSSFSEIQFTSTHRVSHCLIHGECDTLCTSNLFELPRCEGGNRKVTFRASIHTAYRDHKIKENPNGFLERIETIPTDKEHLSQDEVIRLASSYFQETILRRLSPLLRNVNRK